MIVVYDTSNFEDYPMGGQLSSVRNFLRYVAEEVPELVPEILLVGVTLNGLEVGHFGSVTVAGEKFRFLPVALAERDLKNIKRSLRFQYALGLVKFGRRIPFDRQTVNYIHTPEAYGIVRLLGRGRCVVFSHGSFFGMRRFLRFHSGGPIGLAFSSYLNIVVKNADMVFVLDENTRLEYSKLNRNVHLVRNSIDYRSDLRRSFDEKTIRLLFVGRLSVVKNIGPIIEAAESMAEVASLTIVGEGEEHDRLITLAGKKTRFVGGQDRSGVQSLMRECDILVMNSTHEGVPLAILEAMGVGLPIVSTDVGGIGEAAPFGLVAERTDGTASSIAQAVRRVSKSYSQMSNRSFSASARFHYTQVNRSILNRILREIGE